MSNQPKKSSATLIVFGWVCFALGLLLLAAFLDAFVVYAPLLIASFVLAIILITRRDVAVGVTLLVLTLIIPPVLLAYKIDEQEQAESNERFDEIMEASGAAIAKKKAIKFEEVEVYSDDHMMYCSGKVRNHGDQSYDYIKVKVEWIDKNDKVLDTEWIYAVASEGLAPKQAKSFKLRAPKDSRMASAKFYTFE